MNSSTGSIDASMACVMASTSASYPVGSKVAKVSPHPSLHFRKHLGKLCGRLVCQRSDRRLKCGPLLVVRLCLRFRQLRAAFVCRQGWRAELRGGAVDKILAGNRLIP